MLLRFINYDLNFISFSNHWAFICLYLCAGLRTSDTVPDMAEVRRHDVWLDNLLAVLSVEYVLFY